MKEMQPIPIQETSRTVFYYHMETLYYVLYREIDTFNNESLPLFYGYFMFRHSFRCKNWCIMYMCMLLLSLTYDSVSPVYILSYSLLWLSHCRLIAPGNCSLFVKCATLKYNFILSYLYLIFILSLSLSYPMRYTYFAVLYFAVHISSVLVDSYDVLPMFFSFASLVLGQYHACPIANEANLNDMDEFGRLEQNKTKIKNKERN